MRSAGVRFVITDAPMTEAKLRAELTIPTPPSAQQQLLFSSDPAFESFQLYLYELDNPNLGQFSPIEVKQAEDALSIREALVNPLSETGPYSFRSHPEHWPFSESQLGILYDRAGWLPGSCHERGLIHPFVTDRVQPLPHCNVSRLDVPQPRLFRADLALTGVLFDAVSMLISIFV